MDQSRCRRRISSVEGTLQQRPVKQEYLFIVYELVNKLVNLTIYQIFLKYFVVINNKLVGQDCCLKLLYGASNFCYNHQQQKLDKRNEWTRKLPFKFVIG